MFNQKNMIALCVAAGLGFTGAASAVQNAQVNVSGQIAAATCDLSVSNPNIDLGTHISARDSKNKKHKKQILRKAKNVFFYLLS